MESTFNGVPALSQRDIIVALLDELKLTVTQTFIPFSRSRNASDSKSPSDWSLNWKVTVLRDLRIVIAGVDYQAGIGHCPAAKTLINPRAHYCIADAEWIRSEVENGTTAQKVLGMGRKPILADPLDVLYSLLKDANAIDYRDFDEWAEEMGYSTDSRRAESIYRGCLAIGLKLRAGLGQDNLNKLGEAFQDY